ncbi:hypothetical protein LCGC14_0417660 [marine sediment metagenome]|uniref:Glycosyl transferase family 1 domain-containing protein n=1 Tax=marine sediment metagenome TaxID=412755 RepID=A0A0F9SRT6_9ZZZZ
MKILLVTDKQGTAIDILANFIRRENKQHEIDVLQFHPKRPDEATVDFLKNSRQDYDIIHWMYWKSWQKAEELEVSSSKKSILSHFNPYDIGERNWIEHDMNVVCTDAQAEVLAGAPLIRLAVDEQLWKFKPNTHKTIGMCANRIEGKKGILEVAEVAKELGIKFIVMGRISKPDYWKEVLATGADISFYESVPFESMDDVYHSMGVYVVNSVDNFETGPMPPLEAMLAGVPVVSREVGTIGEIGEDGKNLFFFDGKAEMKKSIKEIFDNDKVRDKLREEGWRMAKNYNSVRFAREYNKQYHEVLYPHQPLVSVICPYVQARHSTYGQTLTSIEAQTYKNVEVLALIDNDNGYNLAKIRNKMIIDSHGEYLLFLDDRWMLDDPNTIAKFVKQINNRDKVFLWGDKGRGKRNFVENFSFCKRKSLIHAGMFNERIDKYGGMSQELRARLRSQGWEFKFCEGAKAKEKMSSRGNWRDKQGIMDVKNILYKLGLQ